MERHIFSVTEVNELVKLLLDNEPMLSGICVRGEISNYKMYPSGHHYFSLKDPTGAIRCVMFKGQALRLRKNFFCSSLGRFDLERNAAGCRQQLLQILRRVERDKPALGENQHLLTHSLHLGENVRA